jgi:hypothetical protein
MGEHSRAPHTHPCLMPVTIEERLVHLRLQGPHWGPRKLLHRLAMVEPGPLWSAPSTAGEILTRHGTGVDGHRRSRSPCSLRWGRARCGSPTSKGGSGRTM